MSWIATTSFLCDNASPRHARQFCAQELGAVLPDTPVSEQMIADAVLITSELVTNAVRAGGGRIELHISMDELGVRLAVRDDAPGIPVLQRPGPDEPHGRGLAITAQIAKEWGCDPTRSGKDVWAHLPAAAS